MSKAIGFFLNFYHGFINSLIIIGALLLIGGCDSSSDSSGPQRIIVSIEQSGVIGKSNLASYDFSGKCPKNDEDVLITIGSKPGVTTNCNKNTWELLAVNLTSLVTNGVNIVITVASDDEEVELSLAVDIVSPTATITLENTNKNLVNGAFNVVVNFNEDVTGFDQATDVTITGPLVASAPRSVSASKRSYKVTLTPMANKSGEEASVTVNASVAQDIGGNNNQAVSQGVTVTVDNVPPAVPTSLALSSPPVSPGSDPTPTIKVAGVNGDVIELFTDSGCSQSVGKASVTAGNALVTTRDIGNNGNYEFYAQATDRAGNASSCSSASDKLSYTLNKTLITVALSRPGGNNPPVNGVFNVNIVFGRSVTGFAVGEITVTGGSASSLSGGPLSYSAAITPNNSVSDVVIAIAHGVAQDTSNNAQVNQAAKPLTVAVDRIVPTIQSITGVAGSYRAGGQVNLTVTLSEGVVVSGTPTLTLTVGSNSSKSASYQSGSGTAHIFRYTVGGSDASSNGIVVTAISLPGGATIRDLAGNNLNTTLSSITLSTILVDNTAPSVPSAITFASGLTSPGKDKTPTIEVVGTNGDIMGLFTNVGCTQSVGSTTVSSGKASITTSALGSDGSYSFYAKATDLAGNTSACSGDKLDYQLDTAAPAKPSSIVFVAGLSSPGNDSTPTIEVTGTNGDTMGLFTNAGCTQSVGSAIVGSGKASITTSTIGSDGSYSFYAKATDPAGNASSCSSNKLDYQLDTAAPAKPSSIVFVAGLSSPGNDSTPTIEVTGTNGDTMGLFTNAGCTQSVGSAIVGSGKASITTSALGSDGSYSFYAKATDPAGNASSCSDNKLDYQLDTTAPAKPSSIVLASSLSSPGNDSTPTIEVTGTNGDTMGLFTNVGCTQSVGSAIVGSGKASITTSTLGSDKIYSFYAKATDLAGNASSCSDNKLDYQLDTAAPAKPSSIVFVSGLSSPGSDSTPTIEVTGTNGDTMGLFTDNGCTQSVGSAAVSSGKASITTSALSPDKIYSFYAKATDPAGNASACSSNKLDYQLDTTAPAVPTSLALVSSLTSPGSDSTPTIEVAGTNGDRIELFTNSGCTQSVGSATVSSGKASITTTTLKSDGNYSFYAKAADSIGNQSNCSANSVSYFLQTHFLLSKINLGDHHSCTVLSSGEARCWGQGTKGELGNDADTMSIYPVGVVRSASSGSNLENVLQISAGGQHSCALILGGGVKCWGSGNDGQLGNNASNNENNPVDVDSSDGVSNNLGSIAQVSAGGKHTCALSFTGGVKCWGGGDSGQLGNKADADKDAPVDVKLENSSNLSGIIEVRAGRDHACALSSAGEVKCWGMGTAGQLGNNSTGNKNFAVDVNSGISSSTNLKGIVQISVGDDHTCALTTVGRVKCWGAGDHGRLGNGSDNANKSYPVDVMEIISQSAVPLADVVQISSGGFHTCALKANGQARCWGRGTSGQLGSGSGVGANNPVAVVVGDGVTSPLGGIVQVACGGRHTCVLDNNGQLRCMGLASNGQLGNQSMASKDYPSFVTAGSTGPDALSVGTFHRSYSCVSNSCSIDVIGISLAGATPSPGSNATPTLEVAGAIVGQTVRFYSDRWCRTSAGTNTASSSSASAALSTVSEGVHQFYFEVTNQNGSSLGCSESSLYYIFDQTAPRTPGIALASTSSGTSAGSPGTSGTPAVDITLGNLSDVLKVYKDSSCSASELADVRVYSQNFSLTLAALTSDGTYKFYAQATDRAGNKSACSSATADYYLDLP